MEYPTNREKPIYGDRSTGRWNTPILVEWEMSEMTFSDQHPYDEIQYVLEGELHVESDGQRAVARPGDMVCVRANSTGTYSAPKYARMLGVFDHNPDGLSSQAPVIHHQA